MTPQKERQKYTLITTGLALFFLFAAGGILVFFFQNLRTSDQTYTVVEETKTAAPAAENETPDSHEGGVFPETPILNAEEPSGNAVTGNLTKSDVDSEFEWQLYMRQINDQIEEEFVVDGRTFYRVNYGSSLEPSEKYLSKEEAAHLALSALQHYFPEQDWDYSFFLHLVPVSGDFSNFSSLEANGVIWYVATYLDHAECVYHPTVFLHPITGEVVYILYPHEDPVYNGSTEEGRRTPFISLADFMFLTNPMTWASRGTKIIRALDLNEGESLVRYDRESNVRFSHDGTVCLTFYIGTDESARKLDLFMDLYTQEFVGFVRYGL